MNRIKELDTGGLFAQAEKRALKILLRTMLQPTQDSPECFDSNIAKKSREILDEIDKN